MWGRSESRLYAFSAVHAETRAWLKAVGWAVERNFSSILVLTHSM